MRRALAAAVLALAACEGAPIEPWPAPERLSFSDRPRFAITNNKTDALSFVEVDGAAPALLGQLPAGAVPLEHEALHHIAAPADGSVIYFNISNSTSGMGTGPHGMHGMGSVPGVLARVDATTLERKGSALVDKNPGDVILSADARTAYVSHYDLARLALTGDARSSRVSVLDVSDPDKITRLANVAVCPAAHGEGLSPDGKTLYVTCFSDEIAIVDVSDPRAPSLLRRVPLGPGASPDGLTYEPYALSVSPADGRVYVSCNASGEVRVYDPALGAFDDTRLLALGGVPMFGAFTRDGRTFYVPGRTDARLHAIDLVSGARQTLELGVGVGERACENAHVAHLTPDETRLLVVCEGDQLTRPGTALSLSTQPLALLGYVTLAMFPDGAAYLPPR